MTPEPRILSNEEVTSLAWFMWGSPEKRTLLASHNLLVERVNTLEAALSDAVALANVASTACCTPRALVNNLELQRALGQAIAQVRLSARAAPGVVPVPDTGKETEGGDRSAVVVEETP